MSSDVYALVAPVLCRGTPLSWKVTPLPGILTRLAMSSDTGALNSEPGAISSDTFALNSVAGAMSSDTCAFTSDPGAVLSWQVTSVF